VSETDAARASVEQLSRRIASIPDALRLTSEVPLPAIDGVMPTRIVTTGIGASEGPARMLACALRDGGMVATFVPLMTFALAPQVGDLLVVFSQNLSPNARLALTAQHRFRTRWLVTSVGFSPGASIREPLLRVICEDGVVPIVVPPAHEDGMLVRVVGPAVAALTSLRIGAHLGVPQLRTLAFGEAARTYAVARVGEVFDEEPLALVAAGVAVETLIAARWKILEALLVPEPSVWDVLQVAHGPLQGFHNRRQTLLVCGVESADGLVERMAATLVPARHRVIRFVSRHDNALSYFDHAAGVDACLLATLHARPRNLCEWPGRGADGPLYNLGDS
jgi:creatinine amidohydrolase